MQALYITRPLLKLYIIHSLAPEFTDPFLNLVHNHMFHYTKRSSQLVLVSCRFHSCAVYHCVNHGDGKLCLLTQARVVSRCSNSIILSIPSTTFVSRLYPSRQSKIILINRSPLTQTRTRSRTAEDDRFLWVFVFTVLTRDVCGSIHNNHVMAFCLLNLS